MGWEWAAVNRVLQILLQCSQPVLFELNRHPHRIFVSNSTVSFINVLYSVVKTVGLNSVCRSLCSKETCNLFTNILRILCFGTKDRNKYTTVKWELDWQISCQSRSAVQQVCFTDRLLKYSSTKGSIPQQTGPGCLLYGVITRPDKLMTEPQEGWLMTLKWHLYPEGSTALCYSTISIFRCEDKPIHSN